MSERINEKERIRHAEVAYIPTKGFNTGEAPGEWMRGLALTDSESHGLKKFLGSVGDACL